MYSACGVSRLTNAAEAAAEACQAVLASLAGQQCDLAVAFVTASFSRQLESVVSTIQHALGPARLLGCTAEAVISNREEIEDQPAVVVWALGGHGLKLHPFRVRFERTPDGIASIGLPEVDELDASQCRAVLVLGEPYSSVPESLLAHFSSELPGVPVVGGMASGGGPDENGLIFDTDVIREGAVGLIIEGGPLVTTVVSQGCRPIGTPFVVTKGERNLIHELGGLTPLKRLQELYPGLSSRDQRLIEQGLHLGIAMSELREEFRRGDFLITNVIGADRNTGTVAIGHSIRVGQTVQFHLRDAATADEDLTQLLAAVDCPSGFAPAAGLIFSCNGRGSRMFSQPHHDAGCVAKQFGDLPVAGLFAQGEFGPVGNTSHIHGYTASVILFLNQVDR